jgi:hypothetical protein
MLTPFSFGIKSVKRRTLSHSANDDKAIPGLRLGFCTDLRFGVPGFDGSPDPRLLMAGELFPSGKTDPQDR